jgi:hypothetical protein
MNEVAKEEFITLAGYEEALLMTRENETYELDKFQYWIKSDTLYGNGNKILNNWDKIPVKLKIPLDDVSYFGVNKSDDFGNFLLFTTSIGLIVLAIFYLSAISGGIF